MMLTRCPMCSTTFRVTADQLKARAGKVRCGHCNGVFDALETLVDTPPPAAEPAEAPPASVETSAPGPEGMPSVPRDATSGDGTPVTEPIDLLLEEYGEAPPTVPFLRMLAWATAGLLALGVLLVQATYVFRAELAASRPDLRPQLEDFCALLDCDLVLPRKAELVSIEASDLHPDPQRKNLLVLAATLKNRAPFVQAYPHLELTLTDTRDQPIVRKVFTPAEYLSPDAEASAGFAANGDLAVNLWLDPGEIGASGYRLYLFYP